MHYSAVLVRHTLPHNIMSTYVARQVDCPTSVLEYTGSHPPGNQETYK